MTDHCDNCGLCCMHMRTPPFGPEEFAALPEELKAEIDGWLDSPRYHFATRKMFDADAPCIWLDIASGRCRHYDLRPDVCREFEVGNQSCRMLRQEVGLTVKGLPIVAEDA